MPRIRNVAILIFPDVELLDFCGPFEVFSVANRQTDDGAFNIYCVAETLAPITTRNGLSVVPHFTLNDGPQPDLLLVPGGIGTRKEITNTSLIQWLERTAQHCELIVSVCTGALLLGKAGLLNGLATTTHHVAFDLLQEIAPTATVHRDRRYVDNGRVITSAGIAAGIDMSLHIVARLLGPNIALATAKHMEYPWEHS